MVRVAASLAVSVALLSASAGATSLAGQGQKIDTSSYTIDLFRGPVLAGSRVVGLAGAYEAIAEGVAGYAVNPAAVANRVPWSQSWFDWDLDGGLTLPASITDFDFDNNGDESFNNSAAIFGTGGFGLQFGHFGVGLALDLELYQVDSRSTGDLLNVSVLRALLVAGYAFLDGELVAGLGVSGHNVGIDRAKADTGNAGEQDKGAIGQAKGVSLHLGALWAPAYAPVRVGVSARLSPPPTWTPDARPDCTPPRCEEVAGDFVADGYYLPRQISLPTEIYAGAAVQLFRPFNFRWVSPKDDPLSEKRRVAQVNEEAQKKRRRDREEALSAARREGKDTRAIDRWWDQEEVSRRLAEDKALDQAAELDRQRRLAPYKAMPRGKLLISAGAKVTLPAIDGVGLDSFLRQEVERSGEVVTVQPHLGLEGEPWPGYLVLRAGSYLEPTRFRDGAARLHVTGGLDIRIPIEWSVFGLLDDDTTFRVGGAVDYTDRYFGWGVGAGIWR